MTQTVLILGATGRFGRHTAEAFETAGWAVRRFDRKTDDLDIAAQGVDVIVMGWNPANYDWGTQVAEQNAQVCRVALAVRATVVVPGNVYVFGADTPAPWSDRSKHAATNPLGKIRIDMEAAYRSSGVQTIILRAGDFIDTQASGNWFDAIMTAKVAKGVFSYPGPLDRKHSFAYLPDVGRAVVALAEMRAELPVFSDIQFEGYTVTGQQLGEAVQRAVGGPLRIKQMSWLPLQLARPFWKLGRKLIEMRYLWNTPHSLDGAAFRALLPEFVNTPLDEAIKRALSQ